MLEAVAEANMIRSSISKVASQPCVLIVVIERTGYLKVSTFCSVIKRYGTHTADSTGSFLAIFTAVSIEPSA
ncbi:hypothetical protein D3C73_1656100 [compost metagenome]